MRIKTRISVLSISLAVIPLLLGTLFVGVISYNSAQKALKEEVRRGLAATLYAKKQQVEEYFTTIEKQAVVLAQSRMLVDAMTAFKNGFQNYSEQQPANETTKRNAIADYYQNQFAEEYKNRNNGETIDTSTMQRALQDQSLALQYHYIANNPDPLGSKGLMEQAGDGSSYSNTHALYHAPIKAFLDQFGYYDIFLVDDNSGDIVYSVFKELDFATSLVDGPYASSGIGQAFNKALALKEGEAALLDFAAYLPSYNDSASFIATPVMEQGERIGVLIFQMPIDRINNMMTFNQDWQGANLGNTGEIYLIGNDNKLRSNSRFMIEDSASLINTMTQMSNQSSIGDMEMKQTAIGLLDQQGPTVQAALGGQQGSATRQGYRGHEVLSVYEPINLLGLNWAIFSDIETEEAFAETRALATRIITIAGLFILVALAIAGAVGVVLARRIVQPIEELSSTIKHTQQSGLFNQNISISGNDEVSDAAKALQALLTDTDNALSETKRVVSRMAEGDFSQRIKANLHGDLASLKNAVNKSADETEQSMAAIRHLMNNLARSEFTKTAEEQLKGEYADLMQLIVDAMLSLGNAVAEIQELTFQMSEGNFSHRLQSEFTGELLVLKDSLNSSMQSLSNATEEIVTVAALQAQGDLNARIEGNYRGDLDKLKQSINDGQRAMSNTIIEVTQSAQSVAGAAKEISIGNTDLSVRTNEQATSLEKASTAVKEIAANTQATADSAVNANSLASSAENNALEGKEVMKEAINAMQEIQTASGRISEIVETIDGFAFQTNLLALNAAVEAARAGEHGRGFAVVASEVRALAQKSAQAAQDINTLVDAAVRSVDQGVVQVQRSSENLETISDGISDVSKLVSEISDASSGQSGAIDNISHLIADLDSVATQNAALVEETSAAATSLDNQSKLLLDKMAEFKADAPNKKQQAPNKQNRDASPSLL